MLVAPAIPEWVLHPPHDRDRALLPEHAGRCDGAFVPGRNEWQGETRVPLGLEGVRVA